nr:MFS transporter [Micromonospora sp. DSM 115978]
PILLVGVVGALGLNFPITLALMASETFDGGARTYGLLSAVMAIGSVVGALFAARRRGGPRPIVLCASAAAFGALELISAAAPNLWTFAAVAVPMGAAILLFTTAANATVQLACEPAVRGLAPPPGFEAKTRTAGPTAPGQDTRRLPHSDALRPFTADRRSLSSGRPAPSCPRLSPSRTSRMGGMPCPPGGGHGRPRPASSP